jgi:hypothetical protein
MHRRRDQQQTGRGLVVGSLLFFAGFGLGQHYLFGHQSWLVAIVSSVGTTFLWSVMMAFWLGLLPRP